MTIRTLLYSSNNPERFLSWLNEVLRGFRAVYPEYADAVEKTGNAGVSGPDPSNDWPAATP